MGYVVEVLLGISVAAVVLSFGCGLLLLLYPAWMKRAAATLDRWVSLVPLFTALDTPYYVERRFYRHHKVAGILLVVGATYTLTRLLGFHTQDAKLFSAWGWGSGLRNMSLQLGVIALAIANTVVLAIGVIIYFRPSLLRKGEGVANRWWPTGRSLEPLDTSHGVIDSWLWSHPRRVGMAMLVAGGYILGILTLIWGHLW